MLLQGCYVYNSLFECCTLNLKNSTKINLRLQSVGDVDPSWSVVLPMLHSVQVAMSGSSSRYEPCGHGVHDPSSNVRGKIYPAGHGTVNEGH